MLDFSMIVPWYFNILDNRYHINSIKNILFLLDKIFTKWILQVPLAWLLYYEMFDRIHLNGVYLSLIKIWKFFFWNKLNKTTNFDSLFKKKTFSFLSPKKNFFFGWKFFFWNKLKKTTKFDRLFKKKTFSRFFFFKKKIKNLKVFFLK